MSSRAIIVLKLIFLLEVMHKVFVSKKKIGCQFFHAVLRVLGRHFESP